MSNTRISTLESETQALRGRIEAMEGWTGKTTDQMGEVAAQIERLNALASPVRGVLMPDDLTPEEVEAFKAVWKVAAEAGPTKLVLLPSSDALLARVMEGLASLASNVAPDILAMPIPTPVRMILVQLVALERQARAMRDGTEEGVSV